MEQSNRMSLIILCALQVVVLYSLSVVAIPSLQPPTTTPPPASAQPNSDADHIRALFSYQKELQDGFFTGPWVPNTLTIFERVEAIVETCINSRSTHFYGFLEELGPEYQNRPFIFDSQTLCYRTKAYVRDFRKNESIPLTMSPTIFFRSSDFDNSQQSGQGTYPLNTEAVWQIQVPKGHVAMIVLASVALEPPVEGSCKNDFVSFYTDDEIPNKYCSSLEQVRFFKEDLQTVTIRFQSNHMVNEGGFAGGVWMFPANSFADLARKRSAEPKPQFMDRLAKDISFDQYFDDALDCFSHIVKYGEEGAKAYDQDESSEICKTFSRGFFNNGYSHP